MAGEARIHRGRDDEVDSRVNTKSSSAGSSIPGSSRYAADLERRQTTFLVTIPWPVSAIRVLTNELSR